MSCQRQQGERGDGSNNRFETVNHRQATGTGSTRMMTAIRRS